MSKIAVGLNNPNIFPQMLTVIIVGLVFSPTANYSKIVFLAINIAKTSCSIMKVRFDIHKSTDD